MTVRNDSGGAAFRRYEMVILLLAKLFAFVPKFVRWSIWSLFDDYEGRFSIGIRYCLLLSMAKKCGRNVFVGRGVILKNLNGLVIGDNVSIHAGCYLDAFGGIEIGDNVSIAHQCSIVSFEHTWSDMTVPIKYNQVKSVGVFISSDVWIGCGVRVLDGCRIGERVVVAAGSVAKGTLDAFNVYAGTPAKKIKSIDVS